jgi:hypothetical protein
MAKNKRVNKLLSLVCFLSVVSLVGVGTEYTINKCFEKNTNAEVVANLVNKRSYIAMASIAETSEKSEVLGTTVENASELVLTKCRPQLISNATNARSVFNYMVNMGLDPSFENRTVLALQYGIQDYSGTAEQNKELIYMLTVNNLCQD